MLESASSANISPTFQRKKSSPTALRAAVQAERAKEAVSSFYRPKEQEEVLMPPPMPRTKKEQPGSDLATPSTQTPSPQVNINFAEIGNDGTVQVTF